MNKKSFKSLIFGAILLIAFVFLAWFCGAWLEKDLAMQLFAAIAGAIIAAIITMVLLQGQSDSAETLEKNSKIFEEKLNIYQDFLKELCEVVKDQKIDEEEEIRLQFQVASIAMHTTEESILKISKPVQEIILNIKKDAGDKKEMLEHLFVISDVFHKELYNEKISPNEENRNETIENFKIFLVNKEKIQKYEENLIREKILKDKNLFNKKRGENRRNIVNKALNTTLFEQIQEIAKELNLDYWFDQSTKWNNKHSNFGFYKPEWEHFSIVFEFTKNDFGYFIFGVAYKPESRAKEQDTYNLIKEKLKGKSSDCWPSYTPSYYRDWFNDKIFELLYMGKIKNHIKKHIEEILVKLEGVKL